MDPFQNQIKLEQTAWRKKFLPEVKEAGKWRDGMPRSHILPAEHWLHNVWRPIRADLTNYLDAHRIQPHTDKNNLNSSWVLCANLYFPFRTESGKRLLASFLKRYVSNEVCELTGVELEYEGDGQLGPGNLLGESRGGRGKGQTSPDVAFFFSAATGGSGIILAESKFGERSFEKCSALKPEPTKRRPQNPDSTRCFNIEKLLASPADACHQHSKGWDRKYWNHVKPNAEEFRKLRRCPAAKDGYQLFRQQALAEGFASSGKYETVISCVAYDSRNKALIESMKGMGIANFAESWGKLFDGKAKFRAFTHQQWVQWVRENAVANEWSDWLSYVQTRYGY